MHIIVEKPDKKGKRVILDFCFEIENEVASVLHAQCIFINSQ